MSTVAVPAGTTPTTGVATINMHLGEVVVVAGFWCGYPMFTSKPLSEVTDPLPPPAGPTSAPSETATVQWDVSETATDIPLTAPPATVVVGSVFEIDTEFMTVTDVSNIDNPAVTRATHGSIVAAHAQGARITIWGTP